MKKCKDGFLRSSGRVIGVEEMKFRPDRIFDGVPVVTQYGYAWRQWNWLSPDRHWSYQRGRDGDWYSVDGRKVQDIKIIKETGWYLLENGTKVQL